MIFDSVFPYILKIIVITFKLGYRCFERGCRFHLHKSPQSDGEKFVFEDDVNSKAVIQEDLDLIYTGPEIDGFSLYSQFFTYLWTVLLYSCGLPLLYPIAMLYFIFLYWMNKILILKSYRKTASFSEEFATTSI